MRATIVSLMLTLLLSPLAAQDKEEIEDLLFRLRGKNPGNRANAARDLMKIGPGAAVHAPRLVKEFREEDPAIRQVVTNAVSGIGKAAVPTLQQALADDHPLVRRQACIALMKIGPDSKPALEALGQLATKDRDKEIRGFALAALTKIDPETSAILPYLKQTLKDEEASVRLASLLALEEPARKVETMVPVLAAALKDPDTKVRITTASILARLGPTAKAALPALNAALADPEPEVRVSVASVLVDLDPAQTDKVLALLLKDLASSDEKVRRAAAYVLGQVGAAARSAAPELQKALKDPSADVRQAAAVALDKIKKKEK
jgi:HEAT repeat protein